MSRTARRSCVNAQRQPGSAPDDGRGAHLLADGPGFAEHNSTVHGAGNSVSSADRTIQTNTIEGAFSIFKRGMKSVYQHCGEQHLHCYLAEFEFRYNTRAALGCDDRVRGNRSRAGIIGKGLTYRRLDLNA